MKKSNENNSLSYRHIICPKVGTGDIDTMEGSAFIAVIENSCDEYCFSISVWNIATGNCVWTRNEPNGSIIDYAFSPDEKWLATSSFDVIRLYNVFTGEERRIYEGKGRIVMRVIFTPDGKWLIAEIHNTDSGNISDNTYIAIWDMTTGDCIQFRTGYYSDFSADGKNFAIARGSDIEIRRSLSAGLCRRLKGHKKNILRVEFSPNGKYLYSSSKDNTIRIWNVNTGRCIRILRYRVNLLDAIHFTDNSEVVVLKHSVDLAMHIWNIFTGQCRIITAGYNEIMYGISPDGSMILIKVDDTLEVRDTFLGHCIYTLLEYSDKIHGAYFTRNGKHVVVKTQDNDMHIWTLKR